MQYQPTKWVRLAEVMATTHLIAGAHRCLINEFPHTKIQPFERFLRWQCLNALGLVELDYDLRRAIDEMKIHGNKHVVDMMSQPQRPPLKQFRR